MSVSLRPYQSDDFDKLMALWLASWRSTGIASEVTLAELRDRWPLELARGWIVHVAVVDLRVAGFCAVHRDKLEQLFVAPEAQGGGVGKQLLDLVKSLRPGGFFLETACESRAPAFYEREGLVRGEISTHHRLGHRIVRYDWKPSLAKR